NLKVGICGEHGGEPSSVEFCFRTGLNYVSCSPFRVLTARLAAAQAAAADKLKIEGGRTKKRAPPESTKGLPRKLCCPFLVYCTFCNRAINFCARFSSDSDQRRRDVARVLVSMFLVNSIRRRTLSRILACVSSVRATFS